LLYVRFLVVVTLLSIITFSGYNRSFSHAVLGPTLSDNRLVAEVVYTGLDFPTSMAFLGPSDILVSEKNEGTINRIVNGEMLEEPILKVNVAKENERGMLGIAIAEHRDTNKTFVFSYFTEAEIKQDADESEEKLSIFNRLYRYELIQGKLMNPKLLLEMLPNGRTVHNGGVIIIGPDHNLYVVVGEAGSPNTKSRNIKGGSDPFGTSGILRLTQDGNPAGNVSEGILGNTYPLNLYYAYGIRNSFGMDFDPLTGNLWDTENGPYYGDEINLVKPGFNSGWEYMHGIWEQDEGNPGNIVTNPADNLVNFDGKGKYSDPELTWFQPRIGLTALKFLTSDKLGEQYENDMFVGDWNNGRLYHFDLNQNRTELYLKQPLEDRIADTPDELQGVILGERFGGITDIEVGPDGYLYILSLHHGQDDCAGKSTDENCGHGGGTIYRIRNRI
jgi:glucose/arabinose dehydrogenase